MFFIHGMWGGSRYWKEYKSNFEDKGYKCIATDLLYHDADPARAATEIGFWILDFQKAARVE